MFNKIICTLIDLAGMRDRYTYEGQYPKLKEPLESVDTKYVLDWADINNQWLFSDMLTEYKYHQRGVCAVPVSEAVYAKIVDLRLDGLDTKTMAEELDKVASKMSVSYTGIAVHPYYKDSLKLDVSGLNVAHAETYFDLVIKPWQYGPRFPEDIFYVDEAKFEHIKHNKLPKRDDVLCMNLLNT